MATRAETLDLAVSTVRQRRPPSPAPRLPDAVRRGGLDVGGLHLSAARLSELLATPAVDADVVVRLAHRLVRVLLDQIDGASAPAETNAAVDAANRMVADLGGPAVASGSWSTTVTHDGRTYTAGELLALLG
jgi:hypothetical protein